MSEKDDSELDQLLSRGRLSGRQYDEIERRVLAQVVPRNRWRWTSFVPAAALASSALVVGLLLAGREPNERASKDSHAAARELGFTARGSSLSTGGPPRTAAVIDLGCAGRPAHVCRIGDTLMFSVSGNRSVSYLLAFAERVGGPAGRIWYFPVREGSAPLVEARAETSVLSQGVRLGPPHAVGEYRVTAWLSEQPVDEARAHSQSNLVQSAPITPIVLEVVE
ncbi:MAG TPA: hypothetical protein VJV79_22600 [Polyangiaceae bacterium]|nr:hypothetical protein [Polyangiaceae bacterium]